MKNKYLIHSVFAYGLITLIVITIGKFYFTGMVFVILFFASHGIWTISSKWSDYLIIREVNKMASRAYHEGRQAFLDGKSPDENPYILPHLSMKIFMFWARGYMDAMMEKKKEEETEKNN